MANVPWENETERADYWKSAWNTERKENERYRALGTVEEFAALKEAKSDGKASSSSNVGKPKCTWPDGTEIKPDGVHGLDPCIYVERQILHNVDITIGECEKCGAINIFWRKTANTETVYEDENFVRRSNLE